MGRTVLQTVAQKSSDIEPWLLPNVIIESHIGCFLFAVVVGTALSPEMIEMAVSGGISFRRHRREISLVNDHQHN